MGCNSGGLAGLHEMRYKGTPPPPPLPRPPHDIYPFTDNVNATEVKEYYDETNWLDDELEIQKHKDFNWKPVISVFRKLVWVIGLGYFMWKLTSI